MKHLDYLVPEGHMFVIDEQNSFKISARDFQHISRIGVLVNTLLRTVMAGLKADPSTVSDLLFSGLSPDYRDIGMCHPERPPTLIRVDLMVDVCGRWRIAEIDPANKHGSGFSLAIRYESGAGERQKLLSLITPFVTGDLTIVLGRNESFFRFDQRFFAQKLAEFTGKNIKVIPEEKLLRNLDDLNLILDFPFCHNTENVKFLGRLFRERPEIFINPPRHVLGSKTIMALPYEHMAWLENAGMARQEIQELKEYLPPTYFGPFVSKKVFSSGAKGVFIHGENENSIFQQYVNQKVFSLGGRENFIRMACIFVGQSLGELAVSASTELPVHGGNTAVHYHVNMT